MTVISLTTIPSRFGMIGPTLESLVAQKADIESIRLYIPHKYRRFADYDGSLPTVPKGVEIHRSDIDYGPASKVLHCVEDLRGTDSRIILCDDDRDYPSDWAQTLIEVSDAHPGCAVCCMGWPLEKWDYSRTDRPQPTPEVRPKGTDWDYRKKRLRQQIKARTLFAVRHKPPRRHYKTSGYVDIFGGVGGVLVRPEWFDEAAFDIPPVVWTVDDVWLSGQLARQGVPIWLHADMFLAQSTEADLTDALFRAEIEGHRREEANRAAIEHMQKTYQIWG
ncbi:MAG: glycosyltransferase family 2 protein [Vannielia sp.]|uniref:glycosyltransferase family 2 protein n=1 Tax=Vannielia sp. TaxID=2813045 RepID=UPI003B8AB883